MTEQIQQQRANAADAATQARIQKLGAPTAASMQQAAVEAYTKANPGTSDLEAIDYARGFMDRRARFNQLAADKARSLDQSDVKLQQHQQQLENTQDYRKVLQQKGANDAVGKAAGRILFAAQNGGNMRMTYGEAVDIALAQQQRTGPAPINGPVVGASGQNPITAPAQAPAAGQKRLTMQEAMALPPGTSFIDENGVARTRH